METLGQRIKAARKARGWSQADLGERVGMRQQSIRSIEADETKRPRRLYEIAEALGKTEAELLGVAGQPEAVTPDEPDQVHFGLLRRDIPVRGTAVGGADADFSFNGETIDYVRRPPGVAAARDIFALYTAGVSMFPRFNDGELIYVSGSRSPAIGDDVVIELIPERDGEPGKGFVKRLLRRTPEAFVCQQFNPPMELTYPRNKVARMFRVVPWNELLGF